MNLEVPLHELDDKGAHFEKMLQIRKEVNIKPVSLILV